MFTKGIVLGLSIFAASASSVTASACEVTCLRGNFEAGGWAKADSAPPCWLWESKGYFSCFEYGPGEMCPFDGMIDCLKTVPQSTAPASPTSIPIIPSSVPAPSAICESKCLRGNFTKGGWARAPNSPPCWMHEKGYFSCFEYSNGNCPWSGMTDCKRMSLTTMPSKTTEGPSKGATTEAVTTTPHPDTSTTPVTSAASTITSSPTPVPTTTKSPTTTPPAPTTTTAPPAPYKCNAGIATPETECAGTIEVLSPGADQSKCSAAFTAIATGCVRCGSAGAYRFDSKDSNQCYTYCGAKPLCGKVNGAPIPALTPKQFKCIMDKISSGSSDVLPCIYQQ